MKTLIAGDHIQFRAEGRVVDAVIVLASENARSLAVRFEGVVGRWAGGMALLFDAGRWRGLDGLPCEVITEPIVQRDHRRAFRCRFCGAVSHSPGDLENQYCGRCHLFHEAVIEARQMLGGGATHDCGEWQAAGRCAVCGRFLGDSGPI